MPDANAPLSVVLADDKPPSTKLTSIARRFGLDEVTLAKLDERFPVKANDYYLSLIREKDDPIYKQVIPDARELDEDTRLLDDPLSEDRDSPAEGIVHRYPDRCLLLASNACAGHCRFCTRTRKMRDPASIRTDEYDAAIDYIGGHREIRDVIVSGGDPLMLGHDKLDDLLGRLRSIEHVEIVRIGTRVPGFDPMRVTQRLCDMLRRHNPLFVNVHFEHPRELTPEACEALRKLADAGIPLGNQSVVLNGVNDSVETMLELNRKLVRNRVRPYYMYSCDNLCGTRHLACTVEKGLEIIKGLRGWTSGLAVPQYVIDAPGGGGKIPLLPEYVESINTDRVVLRNYKGCRHEYIQP